MDHQPANRQHKINGFGTAAHTVSNVKVTNDMNQTITLPWDADIDKANVAVIKSKVYDITDIRAATLAGNKSMELDLLYNPVSTMMKTGDTIYGIWDRTPSVQHKAFKVNIADDTLKTSRTIALPKLNDDTNDLFYYQITAKYDYDIDTGTEASSKLCLYGGGTAWNSQFFTHSSVSTLIGATSSIYWVPLNKIVNDIDTVTGLPSASIVDVSITSRCPWKTAVSLGKIEIKNIANDTVVPDITLSPDKGIIKLNKTAAATTTDKTTPGTITLTDYERYCGRVIVCDNLDNEIFEIPTEYFDASNQLTYYCYGSSDFGGLFTHFKFADKTLIWPEGRIPWIGNGWMDYQNTTMAYDREMLANNIEFNKQQATIDRQNALSQGIMNATYAGMMGGMSIATNHVTGPISTGAGIGMSIASTEFQMRAITSQSRLDRKRMVATQNAKDGLMKLLPSSNYQVGYGLDYIMRSLETGGAKIKIQTPANLTSTDFTNYISYRGYPCGKYASFTLTTGFLKGNMFSTPNDTYMPRGNGPEMDALRREIADGVRLV